MILLSLIILIFPIFLYAQTSVTISGELKPSPNQTYSYYIASGLHGISRTNATWTVTNGHFNNAGKTTTLTQDVDIMYIDVVWTKPGQTGTLKYSYTNGNSSYSGQLTVAIQGGSTGGGNTGGGNNGGGYNGGVIDPRPQIPIEIKTSNNVNTFPSNEEIHLSIQNGAVVNGSNSVKWSVDSTFFDIVSQSNNVGEYRVLVLRPKNKIGETKISSIYKSKIFDYIGDVKLNITKPDYKILNSTSIICLNNTITYSINNLSARLAESITWQAGSNLTLVSGQGTSTATFKGSGNGKGVVKATVTYDGVSYPIENSDVWVGAPTGSASEIVLEKANVTVYLEANLPGSTNYSWEDLPSRHGYIRPDLVSLMPENINNRYWVTGSNKCGSKRKLFRVNIGNFEIDPSSLKSALSEPQPTSIRIYSYPTGSLVYQKKNTISFDIQNTNLGEGIYILEMTDQQGNVTREKVIKGKQ